MRWEPLYETTQMKGDGEAHPALSPSDEFANFERWDKGSFGPERSYAGDAAARIHARSLQAWVELRAEARRRIRSSSASSARPTPTPRSSTTQEDNFFGKVVPLEPSSRPIRFDEVITGRLTKDKTDEAVRAG